MKKLFISIIIVDYKSDPKYLIESLDAINQQSYKSFEVIIIHDLNIKLPHYSWLKLKCLGQKVGPAEKRDIGARLAVGEILAFLDDDAYPSTDWLKSLVETFNNQEILGVGGPGVTPPNTGFLEQASGWVSASPLGSGPYTYRFLPQNNRYVDDYPSMNLAVRKRDFLAVGGYDSNYWPGEDTKLCLDLVSKQNKKIFYNSQALVFHHRRTLWIPHLRQNGNYGLHRGYFAKILPQTSFRLTYFLPSLMVVGLIYLSISLFFEKLRIPLIYQLGWFLFGFYLSALLINSVWIWQKSHSLRHGLVSFFSVWITQIWYGIKFLQGFLLKNKLLK